MISICRIYDENQPEHGVRVFVDRLWPRGLTRERVGADFWMKQIAPSNALRKWYSHDPSKWIEFKSRYYAELESNPLVQDLVKLCRTREVVFLFSAKERRFNNAAALKEFVEKKLESV